jgi:ligand-binding SRPBCC domain-containing protein
MTAFTLHTELWLPRSRDEVFPFFTEARNLEAITPPWLRFEVLTPGPIEMRSGTLLDYCIRFHGIPLRWRTEIKEWDPPHRFVDVQLRGPYTLWHHTHTFEESHGGALCVDHVRYRPHGGTLINWLFVRRDVERIFQYRQRRLKELFGAAASAPASQFVRGGIPGEGRAGADDYAERDRSSRVH